MSRLVIPSEDATLSALGTGVLVSIKASDRYGAGHAEKLAATARYRAIPEMQMVAAVRVGVAFLARAKPSPLGSALGHAFFPSAHPSRVTP